MKSNYIVYGTFTDGTLMTQEEFDDMNEAIKAANNWNDGTMSSLIICPSNDVENPEWSWYAE